MDYRAIAFMVSVLVLSSGYSIDAREGENKPLFLSQNTSTPNQVQESPGGKRLIIGIDPDGVQRVEINAGEYFFEPNTIVMRMNMPVELLVRKTDKSSGIIPHNITVKAPEAGIDFSVDLKKEPKSIKFTPTKTGTYEFYCGKKAPLGKTHKEKGMKGTFEVVQ